MDADYDFMANIFENFTHFDARQDILRKSETTPRYYEEFEDRQNLSSNFSYRGYWEYGSEDNKKLMMILGRIIEFCLLFLIIVTSVLCFILVCAINFC